MTAQDAGNLAPGTKPCSVCAEPINANAKKCIHCGSYQDWHSNLGLSSSILSLLVALVTVSTAAIPVIKAAFTPKDSAFVASIQDYNFAGGVSLLVSNTGIRPGSIRELSVYVRSTGYKLKVSGDAAMPVIIEPGKSWLVRTDPDFDGSKFTLESFNESCAILLFVTNFSGKSERIDVACPKNYEVDFSQHLHALQNARRPVPRTSVGPSAPNGKP